MLKYKYWIALERSKNISISGMNEIYSTLKTTGLSMSDVYDLDYNEIKHEFNFSEQTILAIIESKNILESVEEEYFSLIEAKIQPILFFENKYPKKLHLMDADKIPPILYCLNDLSILNGNTCSIIGESDASIKGEQITYLSAKELSFNHITILTGLTKGIGRFASKSAMENGGKTVGILPCGIFTFNMSEHLLEVYDPDRFLIISPFSPYEPITESNAKYRNMIICALSNAIFIVESAETGVNIECAKSALKLKTPIFTAEYTEYPQSAKGNRTLIDEYGALSIRGKKVNNSVHPNIDPMLARIKLSV